MPFLKGQFIAPDKPTLFRLTHYFIFLCICMQVSHDADNPLLMFIESSDRRCRRKLGLVSTALLVHETFNGRPCLHMKHDGRIVGYEQTV